ncbi:MAG: indolepyruvate oxidoreductase subunit beta [Desulfobacteraceae bacterium]
MDTKRCVFVGVGGQGNLLASRLLGEAALAAGIPAVVSEIHGMAQRGGVVESAVLMGEVTSPIVSNGEADILVGFEPLETLRALTKCSTGTMVITNVEPLPPFTVSIGQGVYPSVDQMVDLVARKVAKLITLNGNELAEEAGNPLSLNMVMLGALIGSGATAITPEGMKETISTSTKKAFLESNLKAFDLGMQCAG